MFKSMKRRRTPPKTPWARRKEILVITPADALTPSPGKVWMRLFEELSRDWRVFWVRAPMRGETVEAGQTGLDPVSIDTFPAIKRVLAEHVISTIFLVGPSTVETCLESLHAFASHIPYMAVLDEPWPAEKLASAQFARLEFVIGLADRLLLTDGSQPEGVEPFLRRLPLALDVMPRGGDASGLKSFSARLSTGIETAFHATQATLTNKTPPSLTGLLPRGEVQEMEKCVQDWRRSVPGVEARTMLAPAGISASGKRRLDRQWPRSRWQFYRDEHHRIELLNTSLRGCKTEFALVLTETAVLQPLSVERMLSCGRKLPLVGGVTYNRPAVPVPLAWSQWVNFGYAWMMRFNGSYRAVPQLHDDCFLLNRSVLDAVGSFDTRLGWNLAVRDYCLRLRQAGYNLFIAEDSVVSSVRHELPGDAARSEIYVNKWNIDPLALTKK
jgi:hypothetical protein